MLGAQLLTQALKEAGVTKIFSLSGNQIMPVYDACIDAGIHIVHTRHEGAAVYMADAWAQLTGEIGVAMIAAGPGFANGLSPLFSAKHAESPVLLLSGDAPIAQEGLGGFQELDQLSMTAPMVKEGLRPTKPEQLVEYARQLIARAQSGRAGPVHLALPFDLLNQKTNLSSLPAPAPATPQEHTADLHAIIQLLAQAKKPLIITGPQCTDSRAGQHLNRVREASGLPVIPMESPRGLNDPALGNFRKIVNEADAVVIIGKKIDFTLDFGRSSAFSTDTKIAIIDPDTEVLAHAQQQLKTKLTYSIQSDALPALIELSKKMSPSAKHSAWTEHVKKNLKNRKLRHDAVSSDNELCARDVCTALQELIERHEQVILISDGGEFGQWVQAFCRAPKRIINGVSGAIGGGIPYAIAAKLAYPQALVVVAMGDGTAGFHLSEFDTAVREQTNFIALIGNDHKWNAEHLIQMREYGEDRLIGCTLNPKAHYEAAAQALGGKGFQVRTLDALQKALIQAAKHEQVVCINAHIKGEAAPEYIL